MSEIIAESCGVGLRVKSERGDPARGVPAAIPRVGVASGPAGGGASDVGEPVRGAVGVEHDTPVDRHVDLLAVVALVAPP